MSYFTRNRKNIVCLVPTWFTSGHALGAYRSFVKFYPDIPVFFVDDEWSLEGVNNFGRTYIGGVAAGIFDPDYTKLVGLPNSAYIRVPHEGFETEGHGNAITKAMPLIQHKWIFHLSSDVRLMKPGLLEYLFEDVTDKYCGIGEEHDSMEGWPNVKKEMCFYRGDLYHKYNLHFEGGGKKYGGHIDCGTIMYRELVKKGFKIKYCDTMSYGVHLRPGHEDWGRLYSYENV